MQNFFSLARWCVILGCCLTSISMVAQWKWEAITTEKGTVSPLWCSGTEMCYAQGIKAKTQDGTWMDKWERRMSHLKNQELPFQMSAEWMIRHQATDYCCLSDKGVFFSKYLFPEKKGSSRLFFWDGQTEVLIPTGQHDGEDIHPAWDERTQTLFFSSNRKGGYGGFDIYRMHWKQGVWSEVAILQSSVNSEQDERYCAAWKGDLYFSTKTELGDWDIFKSPLEGAWTMKWQLEAPINSEWDDVQWIPYDDGWGGLVSNRNEGAMRLFFLKKQFEQRRICLFGPSGARVEIEGVEVEKISISLNEIASCCSIPIEKSLRFTLKDSLGMIIPFGYLLIRDENGRSLAQGVMDVNGHWDWSYVPFHFSAMSLLQWPDESLLALSQNSPDEWGGAVLSNLRGVIYFESGASQWKDEDQRMLEEWASYLNHHPTTRIQIKGFADAKGKEDFNERLALARAMKVQDFLIQKGVSISQLDMDYSGRSVSKQSNQERKVTLSILP